MSRENPDATTQETRPDEARLLDSLNVLLQAANRKSEPGIEARAKFNQLEITLRFDTKSIAIATLRKMAAISADRAE